MSQTILYFLLSFLGDFLAYIFYQQYIDSQRKNLFALLSAIVSAAFVWIFIFKLQDKGLVLRFFIPLWAAGTAVFGYFVGAIATKTPLKEVVNFQALVSVFCIGIGVYLLQKITIH